MSGAARLRLSFVRYAGSMRARLPKGDQQLVQIIDAALGQAARQSGDWLVCRKGCTQCCYGPFPISQLDAARLRQGLSELKISDPQRARKVQERAGESVARLAADFPGNAKTGILDDDEAAQARFEEFADDEPCPALDPATGACDLYSARPMTCRTFGPPVRSGPEGALGVCELCYHGATDDQIAACEMVPDPQNLEEKLLQEVERRTGKRGSTIVAWCLAG